MKPASWNFRVTASYWFYPTLAKFKAEREQAERDKEAGLIHYCPPVPNFEESRAMAFYEGNNWRLAKDEMEVDDFIRDGTDVPMIYLYEVSTVQAGIKYKTNDRHDISGGWLSEELSYIDWNDLIIDAAKLLQSLKYEACIHLLYPMGWESSVDWETGIDEGGFQIGEGVDHFA